MNSLINETINNLEANNFQVHFSTNKQVLIDQILQQLATANSISRGGSVSIEELALIPLIKKNNLPFRDYINPTDRFESVRAEYYLTGVNAITKNGQLVNTDGCGNRIAAISYGPKYVLVIAGINKIVSSIDEAFQRIANTAAPLNTKRLNKNTPCATTGRCSNCNSEDRICRTSSIVHKPIKGRITIYLFNESLGF